VFSTTMSQESRSQTILRGSERFRSRR
jgi:hypothetical protein